MRTLIPARVCLCLGALFSLTHCGGGSDAPAPTNADTGASNATSAGTNATNGGGGSGSSGSDSSTTTVNTTVGSDGTTTTSPATSSSTTGDPSSSNNNTTSAGSTTTDGGTSASGSGGASGSGSPATTTSNGGNGSTTTGGMVDTDQNGKTNACPGEETSTNEDYLRLGDLRVLNNRWGSTELGCASASLRVFANQGSVGWDFSRGACGSGGQKPDFPEVEFGIHPFGVGSPNETSPSFSSTTLLPVQINAVSSMSVNVNNLNINLGGQQAWNIAVEFWLSEQNPVDNANPGTYAEVIAFWGWQNGRWECDTSSIVSAGNSSYDLCHQVDDWADGQWRYFQFRMVGGPVTSYNGTVDIKPFIDWLVNSRGYSQDLWVTRMEVGSEIDDETDGTLTVNDLTFEVNGQSRSFEFCQ